MYELIYIWIATVLIGLLALRKALVVSTTLGQNVASFVNVTSDRLSIRKLDAKLELTGTLVVNDAARMSIDETTTNQAATNDTRSHILQVLSKVGGAAGAGDGYVQGNKVLNFNRGDLVLDPDEAITMHLADLSGAPPLLGTLNIWYEEI